MNPACVASALDFHSDDRAVQEACKAVCGGCELRVSCLTGAIARDEPAGVWGGEVFPRVAMAEPQAWIRPQVYAPVHGSRAAYVRCTDGADGRACDKCRAGNASWMANWRQQRAWTPPVVRETPPEQLDLFGQVTSEETIYA